MPPYQKEQNSEVFDDGWAILDGDLIPIAHLETESLADACMAALISKGEGSYPAYENDEITQSVRPRVFPAGVQFG